MCAPNHQVLRTIASLADFAELIRDGSDDLYVRWSPGPSADAQRRSKDELTGVELPGLSASPLAVEEWWGERPLRVWAARRLYDYAHLPRHRSPHVRPWVLRGREVGRGPDNEPLVAVDRPIAWIAKNVLREAVALIDEQRGRWGTLERGAAGPEQAPHRHRSPHT